MNNIDAVIKSNTMTLERPYYGMKMQNKLHKQFNMDMTKSTSSQG